MHQRVGLTVSLTFLTAAALAACGGGQVTVQVLTEGAEGELVPQRDMVVEFLPFDRDSIFDALEARADQPEPPIPAELQATFDSVSTVQARWRAAETEWGEVRDQLQQLSRRLQNMDQRSREYRELFDRFNSLEGRERTLNQQRTRAFARFDSLQKLSLGRADSVRAVRDAWAEDAFEDYLGIVDSLIEARGREIHQDTTDAEGHATVRLPGGTWWVHTRLDVGQFDEFYWNVQVDPSQTDTLRLTPENAQRRLRL